MTRTVTKSLISTINAFFASRNFSLVTIGFSGGIDSTVLVDACSQSDIRNSLEILHINHKLSNQADQWAYHCRYFAEKKNLRYHQIDLDSYPSKGQSIEQWARDQRYDCYQKHLRQYLSNEQQGMIAVAHHKQDVAETFLLQALRGAGIAGLSAMAPEIDLNAQCKLVRPFLRISSKTIEQYAEENALEWIDDPSNWQMRYSRNFIRHHIFPELAKHYANYQQVLARCSTNLGDDLKVYENYLKRDLTTITDKAYAIDHSILLTFEHKTQRALLKYWIKQQISTVPTRHQLIQLTKALNKARNGWYFNFNQYHLKLTQNKLSLNQGIVENWYSEPSFYYVWDGLKALTIAELNTTLTIDQLKRMGINTDALNWQNVVVRSKKSGDRCKPIDRNHSNRLKKIFQEKAISPEKRRNAIIVTHYDHIIAVVPYFICDW